MTGVLAAFLLFGAGFIVGVIVMGTVFAEMGKGQR